jgi:hypothetical protein
MGFLLKDSSAEYLLDAIRTVSHEGNYCIRLSRKLMQESNTT